jgi:isopentenyl-diphosphate delta-isomerase
MDQPEHVVLVNENNTILGTILKSEVHQSSTPLHRAFSCFLFNDQNQLLIQQRALTKKTWPGIWSNSVCGHPLPNEETKDAVHRRMQYELRLPSSEIIEMLPDFRYRASFQGVEENELCPVWVGRINTAPQPNPDEVETTNWLDWNDLVTRIRDKKDKTYDHFSVWCREEVILLDESKKFRTWMQIRN